jgi:hypothetical protein
MVRSCVRFVPVSEPYVSEPLVADAYDQFAIGNTGSVETRSSGLKVCTLTRSSQNQSDRFRPIRDIDRSLREGRLLWRNWVIT